MTDSTRRPDRLALFGVFHVDRLGKVTTELRDVAEGADAVFIEYPDDGVSIGTAARALVRAPAYVVGMLFAQLLVFVPLYALCNRDLVPTERLAAERIADGRPVHEIDEHPTEIMSRTGPGWILLNWLLFGGAIALDPIRGATTALVVVLGWYLPLIVRRGEYRRTAVALALLCWCVAVLALARGRLSPWLAASALLAVVTVAWSINRRNDHMLERVETLSNERGYDRAVLITGKGHLGGMVRSATERDVAVGDVHVSKWFRTGETRTDADPAALPDTGVGSDQEREHPRPIPGSERDALAPRVGAGIVDATVLLVLTPIAAVVAGVLAGLVLGDGAIGPGVVVGGLLAPPAYWTILEARYGRTLGKRLTGLVVTAGDGGRLSLTAAFLRNLVRPADLILLFLPMWLTDRHQRFGDLVAETVVVEGRT